MNKKLSVFLLSLLAAVSVLSLTACSNSSKVAKDVEAHQKRCPRNMSDGLELESVTLQGDSAVVYTVVLDESAVKGATIAGYATVKEQIRQNVVNQLRAKSFGEERTFLENIRDEDMKIIYCYKGKQSPDTFWIVLNPEEIIGAK